jgi:zinc transport system substrate-binding protein
MRRGTVVVALVGLAATATAACGGGARSSDDGRTHVVAGFYPLAEVARRVGGPDVVVTDLTPAGAEPHDLELSTDQVDAIEDADLVLYLGHGFQPAVEAAARRSEGERLDLLAGQPGDDPHVWLDPVALQDVVNRVRKAMPAADAAATDAFLDELRALDRDFAAGLADCERRTIVTAHAAFGRLAARYDHEQVAITGGSPESEPEPRRLAALADQIRRTGVTTVFTEALVSPRVAETLAREAGVTTAVLDPIEALTAAQVAAGDDYGKVMRRNLTTLRTALGCR